MQERVIDLLERYMNISQLNCNVWRDYLHQLGNLTESHESDLDALSRWSLTQLVLDGCVECAL